MGTRSLTIISEKLGGDEFMVMYRQMDGYPSGHGVDLFNALKDVVITDGIGGDELLKTANGMGCLAAQLVGHFKTEPGGIYLYPSGTRDVWEDYIYTLYPLNKKGNLQIQVETTVGTEKSPLFKGSIKKFGEWLKKREE